MRNTFVRPLVSVCSLLSSERRGRGPRERTIQSEELPKEQEEAPMKDSQTCAPSGVGGQPEAEIRSLLAPPLYRSVIFSKRLGHKGVTAENAGG